VAEDVAAGCGGIMQAFLSVDLDSGSEILRILDRAKVKVSVALWAHLSDYEDWRLVLAGRQFDASHDNEGLRVGSQCDACGGLPNSERTSDYDSPDDQSVHQRFAPYVREV
jgi:hypothetical protein